MMGVETLGIGFPYIASIPAEFYLSGAMDFVEISPEILCRQRANGPAGALEIVPEQMDRARRTCAALPTVVHGVELSIGSVHGCNGAYLEMLDRFHAAWPFEWHSEHLGFQTFAGGDGTNAEVGVPLPLPATREAVKIVAQRSAAIGERYGVPFLLENPAYYIAPADLPSDEEIGDDVGMMNAIMALSGCHQLLDLHNIYCNSLNHGLDPVAILDRVPLNRVLEIHVAGGSLRDGYWMDGHNARVPERVWELLEYVLPNAPHVRGVVFEMLDEFAPRLGVKGIAEELAQARAIWNRCRGVNRYAAA
jgi:uncharacterized protein (UPF0276 family)